MVSNLSLTNRVAIEGWLTVQSVNGPAVTVIQGNQVPGTTNGASAVRCVYLGRYATLSGFTVTNGATRDSQHENVSGYDCVGGGVYCDDNTAHVYNCVIAGNSTSWDGGGGYQGTFVNCIFRGNTAHDNGGGASFSTLNNCSLSYNSAYTGGGAGACNLNNCTVVLNRATYWGAGVSDWIEAYPYTANNCLIYYNFAPSYANYHAGAFNFCCAAPAPGGTGNFDREPGFTQFSGKYRLTSTSPCINAGNNAYNTTSADLDGNPRIVGGTVDIGAYEHQSPPFLSYYSWLQDYGLSTYSGDLYADSDNDRQNNWQEWRCGTVPTNALSRLRIQNLEFGSQNPAAPTVTWESVTNRSYFLERATNLNFSFSLLTSGFSTVATNLPGQSGKTSFTDTNAVGSRLFYYRVGVEQ